VVRPSGFYVSLLLDVISILAAIGASSAYLHYLAGTVSLWVVVAAAGTFILAGIFPLLFTVNFSRRLLVRLIEVVGLIGFFYDQPFLLLLTAGAATYFFFLWGEWVSRDQLKNGLQIRFGQATKDYINKAITGLCMLAVLLFLPQWQAEQSVLSEGNFRTLYGSSTGFVNQFYQELKLDGNFGEFAQSFVRLQFTGNLAFEQLLPPAKEKAIEEGKAQFVRDLEQSWGMQIPEDKPLSTVAYDYLIRLLEKWRATFGERFLAAWAIVAFFVVRSFGYVVSLFISGIGYFIFQVLLAMNVVHIRGETMMKERIEYS
jgi:hypothetical protein